jgi:hypothetical protein
MSNTIKGRLIFKGDAKNVSKNPEKSFFTREFVIEYGDQYKETPQLQLTGDNCDLLDQYVLNDILEVSFNLNGRSYEKTDTKVKNGEIVKEKTGEIGYFTTAKAYKIEKVGHDSDYDYVETKPAIQTESEPTPITKLEYDDLPF